MRSAVCSLALLLAFGCDSGTAQGDLVVRVKSDLQPGFEFTEIRTTLVGVPTSSDGTQIVRALTSEHPAYLSGREVATFRDVIANEPVVQVQVMAGETVLLERNAVAPLGAGATVVTILATRDCRATTCPSVTGAATATECVGGACVPRTCTPEHPGTCPPPPCSRDSDCDNGGIECAQGRCTDGRCLLAADESLCGADQHCALDLGCVGSAPLDDGGIPDAAP
ncbi:MAG: hypothetical protein R3B82_27385 [Sandaracinaceae bacterium]